MVSLVKAHILTQFQVHPWVTQDGKDPLLPAEENCADLVEPPTEKEMNHAITNNMGNLLVVMRAVKRFKRLISRKRPHLMDSFFGRESRIVQPPLSTRTQSDISASRSVDAHDRRPLEQAITREGVHRTIPINDELEKLPAGMDRICKISSHPEGEGGPTVIYPSKSQAVRDIRGAEFPSDETAKGHARDPLKDTLYLDIGVNPDAPDGHGDPEHPILSESPSGVETSIYEQAYQDEVDRVLQQRGRDASMYLNRRVEHRDDLRSYMSILDQPKEAVSKAASLLGGLISKKPVDSGDSGPKETPVFIDIVKQAREKKHAEAGAEAAAGETEGADEGVGGPQA
jgi:[calcium/calmodulin-dependent protein kinase] kinase